MSPDEKENLIEVSAKEVMQCCIHGNGDVLEIMLYLLFILHYFKFRVHYLFKIFKLTT